MNDINSFESLIAELIRQDNATNGCPIVPDHHVGHARLLLGRLLVEQDLRNTYFARLQLDYGTQFRHLEELSEDIQNTVVNKGVEGVADRGTLALLLLNPSALYGIANEIDMELPDVWAELLLDDGRRLMQAHRAKSQAVQPVHPANWNFSPARVLMKQSNRRNTRINDSEDKSTAIIAAFRADADEAFRAFYEVHVPTLLNYVKRKYGFDDVIATDVIHKACMAIRRKIGDFERRGSLRNWFKTICRNKALDYQRKEQRQVATGRGGSSNALSLAQFEASAVEASDDEKSEDDEKREIVARAFCRLQKESRISEDSIRAFELLVIHRKSIEEVAEELGISVVNVRSKKHRVLARLREIVGD